LDRRIKLKPNKISMKGLRKKISNKKNKDKNRKNNILQTKLKKDVDLR